VYPVEADAETFNLMILFAGLDPDRISDRQTVTHALAKLLRLAVAALLREHTGRR
jgi:hypothetical protein